MKKITAIPEGFHKETWYWRKGCFYLFGAFVLGILASIGFLYLLGYTLLHL